MSATTKKKYGFPVITMLVLIASVTLVNCGGGGGGTPGSTASAITAQPTDQSVVAGTTATFNVVATDATGYHWQRSSDGGTTFTDVNGATAASHTTPVTALTDSGAKYRVVVSGAGNSVTSSAVTLTVTPIPVAPSISVQPANQTITAGQNASFSVTATGTSITYQWQRSADGGTTFNNEAGATNATLTLTAVPLANNSHQFRVVVSNSAGSVTSNAALLTVVTPAPAIPAFSTQAANQSVIAPNTATFAVVVTGSPSPTLQWQLSTNAGVSFADIAGATASSYTTLATSTADSGKQYRVIATNSAGTVNSNAAVLTVNAPPTYTVGGTVSGLGVGKSVVLQNNGGDNLTVSAAGAFTFTTQMANSAAYDIRVFTQPVLQTCTIANVGGTVSGANVTNVSVTCVVSIALPKTGQTLCYDATGTIACAGTGQDGELKVGVVEPVPRFVVGSGATAACVTDSLTGLMWVRVPSLTGDTWANALIAANGLTLCGFTDWRLSNLVELGSLLNYSVADNAAVLTAAGFSNIGAWYWTSTTLAAYPLWVGVLNIADGNMTSSAAKTYTYPRTLPVRGP